MEQWVGCVHLVVTAALVFVVAFYGRKYGKTFEAAKQAEVEAKNAWIAKLEGELKLLREMSSENMRKHTIAMKEQLDERIRFLEERIVEKESRIREMKEIDSEKELIIESLREDRDQLAVERKVILLFQRYHQQYMASTENNSTTVLSPKVSSR